MGNLGWISFHSTNYSAHTRKDTSVKGKKKKEVCSTLDHNKNFSGKSRYVRFQSSCRKWRHWTPELQLRWKLPETNSPDEATTKKICRDFHIFSHARHKFDSAFSSVTELMFDNSSLSIQLIKHRSFHLAFHSGLVVFLPRVMLSMNKKQREMCRWSHFQGGKINSISFWYRKIWKSSHFLSSSFFSTLTCCLLKFFCVCGVIDLFHICSPSIFILSRRLLCTDTLFDLKSN